MSGPLVTFSLRWMKTIFGFYVSFFFFIAAIVVAISGLFRLCNFCKILTLKKPLNKLTENKYRISLSNRPNIQKKIFFISFFALSVLEHVLPLIKHSP